MFNFVKNSHALSAFIKGYPEGFVVMKFFIEVGNEKSMSIAPINLFSGFNSFVHNVFCHFDLNTDA